MKRLFLFCLVLMAVPVFGQQPGYEIKVTFKPFKYQFVYLGHYYGKQLPIIDSILLDGNSEGVFKGDKKLTGGIYLIGFPNKNGFFEMLVDKDQHFSVLADSSRLPEGVRFIHSPGNELFQEYQAFMRVNGKKMDDAQKALPTAKNAMDSAAFQKTINTTNTTVKTYREKMMKEHPESMLTFLLKAMREPEVPANPANDSTFGYRFYKSHYWDDVNFYDGRLVNTPFFESKLDKYFEQVVYPSADSVNKEIDWMLGYASISPDMQRFLLTKFINRYLNMKYMWEDAVFVHLYERYFSQKKYDWLTEKGEKTIQDRAYSLMANIMGNAAADIDLPDTSGQNKSLYNIEAPFVVVAIWDPLCGHCKEVIPKLDSLYRQKWKGTGLRIFAMAKETEGKKKDWLNFIREHHLEDWTNVYYSRDAEKARVDQGIPGYSQLYDVLSFPTLYLLDKDKRIIAKKLTFEQIDEVLQYKLKGQ